MAIFEGGATQRAGMQRRSNAVTTFTTSWLGRAALSRGLLLVLLAASLAVFGGIYRWATAPLFAGAVLVALASSRTLRFPRSFRVLDIALLSLIAALVLQCTPLPVAVRDLVSPHANRVATFVQLSAVGRDDAMRPLSLDGVATLHALATLAAALLVFWSMRGLFADAGVRKTCRGIVVIGGLVAVVALVQRATTPLLIYGVWTPETPGATPLGPFVNRNHFGAWLAMAIPLVTGYFVAHVRIHLGPDLRDQRRLLALWRSGGVTILLAIAAMSIGLVASLSRSAIVGLAVGGMAGWALARSRAALGGASGGALALAGAAVLLAVMATVDPDQLAVRLGSTLRASPTDRLTIWRETMPMVRDFWLTGVGAGSYSLGMLVYQQTRVALAHLQIGGWAHFNQAHSHYMQVVAEGGLLLTLPVLASAGAFVVSARRALTQDSGEAGWIRVGAAAGLIAVATQSIWETGLRLPANAFLCATLAAIVVHQREPHGRPTR